LLRVASPSNGLQYSNAQQRWQRKYGNSPATHGN
jgi:hypothetical protein